MKKKAVAVIAVAGAAAVIGIVIRIKLL